MDRQRVLVTFSSRSGSTAGIAELVASVLRSAGLAVDCRSVSEVDDLAAYGALVLGSGVFVPRRASDGGGFLARHAAVLRRLQVWLFCVGPIGHGHGRDGLEAGAPPAECRAVTVARLIGARGVAVFGPDSTKLSRSSYAPSIVSPTRTWPRFCTASPTL